MSGIIKYTDLKAKDVLFEDLKDVSSTLPIKIANICTKNSRNKLKIQSPYLFIESDGIPRESQFTPNPKDRYKFKWAFCQDRNAHPDKANYPEQEKFQKFFEDIDKICDTDDFRKQMFGEKNHNKYTYQKLVKRAEIDEENIKVNKHGKPYYHPYYIVIKLPEEYKKNEDEENQQYKPNFTVFEKVNNKRTEVELKTFEDVVNTITWNSTVRFIITFSKFYAMKTNAGKDKKSYGITLVLSCAEVQPSAKLTKQLQNDVFLDSDEEDNTKTTEPIIQRKENNNENNNLDNNIDESESDDEVIDNLVKDVNNVLEIDDDIEEVIEEQKVKSNKKTAKKK
jgi:hypothetical protein